MILCAQFKPDFYLFLTIFVLLVSVKKNACTNIKKVSIYISNFVNWLNLTVIEFNIQTQKTHWVVFFLSTVTDHRALTMRIFFFWLPLSNIVNEWTTTHFRKTIESIATLKYFICFSFNVIGNLMRIEWIGQRIIKETKQKQQQR